MEEEIDMDTINACLSIVTSPRSIPFHGQDKSPRKVIERTISSEFRIHKRWTRICTQALQNNPLCLFLYDRMEFF